MRNVPQRTEDVSSPGRSDVLPGRCPCGLPGAARCFGGRRKGRRTRGTDTHFLSGHLLRVLGLLGNPRRLASQLCSPLEAPEKVYTSTTRLFSVDTDEEQESVEHSQHARLHHFHDSEWKEKRPRAIGRRSSTQLQ